MKSDLSASLESKAGTSWALLCELTHLFQLFSPHPTRRSFQETSAPVQTFPCLPVGIDLWLLLCKRCPFSEVALPCPCPGDGWSRACLCLSCLPQQLLLREERDGGYLGKQLSLKRDHFQKSTHQLSEINTRALLVDWGYSVENRVRGFSANKMVPFCPGGKVSIFFPFGFG